MTIRALALVAGAALAALTGCGDNLSVAPDEPPGDSLLSPPPVGQGVQLGMKVAVASGEEVTYCQYITLPDAMELVRFEHAYTTGSHHMILFSTWLTPEQARTDRFECANAGFTELGVTGIAYAAQNETGDFAYPDDVAFKLPARSVVLVQSHYLNATEDPIDADIRLNLWKGQTPAHQAAGTLFFYDWAIYVPADRTSVARMRCPISADVTLSTAASHMHRRGVDYRAVLEGGVQAAPTMLYETTEWEGIEPRRFTPAMPVRAGQIIDYQCKYNGDGAEVVDGPSAKTNEMCMFIAMYWPRQDQAMEACAGGNPVFSGSKTCGQVLACMNGAQGEIATEKCIQDTCAASGDELSGFVNCAQQCDVACADGGKDCDECIGATCGAELTACQAATCS